MVSVEKLLWREELSPRAIVQLLLMERQDVEVGKRTQKLAREILTGWFDVVERFHSFYFGRSTPRKNTSNLDLFLTSTEYAGKTIVVVVKLQIGSTHGTYSGIPQRLITLYNSELQLLLQELQSLGETSTLINVDSSENEEARARFQYLKKKSTAVVAELQDRLFHNSELFSTLSHELVHFFDDLGPKLRKSSQSMVRDINRVLKKLAVELPPGEQFTFASTPETYTIYANANHEYNARFLAGVSSFLQALDAGVEELPQTVNQFLELMTNDYIDYYDAFNRDSQRRVVKRLTVLFQDLQKL